MKKVNAEQLRKLVLSEISEAKRKSLNLSGKMVYDKSEPAAKPKVDLSTKISNILQREPDLFMAVEQILFSVADALDNAENREAGEVVYATAIKMRKMGRKANEASGK